MRRAVLVLLCAALTAPIARGAEPVRIKLDRVGEPYVIDGGRRVLVVSRNPTRGSFWATVEAASGKVIRRVEAPQVELKGAAFAASTPAVVAVFGKLDSDGGGGDAQRDGVGYLAAFDITAGTELSRVRDLDREPVALALTADGSRALAAFSDRTVGLFDMRSGKTIRVIEIERDVDAVAISADGQRGLLGGDDEDVFLWDLEVNQELTKFAGHRGKITHVSFWPDGRKVLSASEDGTIRLWDAANATELRRMRAPDAPVVLITPHPDGRRILAATNAPFGTCDPLKSIFPVRDVRLWDALTGQPLGEPKQYSRELVEAIGFGAGGAEAVTVRSDYTIERRSLPAPPGAEAPGLAALDRSHLPDEPDAQLVAISSDDNFRRMLFLPDGRLLTMGDRNVVTRWDVERGVRIGAFVPPRESDVGDVTDVSGDGRLAVSERGRNAATVWELASGLPLSKVTLAGDDADNYAVVSRRLSPDGALLALGLSTLDSKSHVARFFHARDGTPAGKVELPGYGSDPLAYSPDGARIAVADVERNVGVGVFDLDTGKQVKTLRLPKGVGGKGRGWMIMDLRFSADGKRILTEAEDRLIGWSVEDEKVVGDVAVPRTVQSIAFSPDGRRVLTGGDDSNVRLWDLATGKQIALFDHPRGSPLVAFTPDGTRAVAATDDGIVRVFRLPEAKRN
jgi:WD40 repeat protein